MSVKFVTVRLNFEKEQHRKAWEVLQRMSKEENASYSDTITKALAWNSEVNGSWNDGIEEIVEKVGKRIVESVERILRLKLPSFLSGASIQGNMVLPAMPVPESTSESMLGEPKKDTIPDEEIPWDYLGG